jgi:YidC/Oxa1 family membrane protein insertase
MADRKPLSAALLLLPLLALGALFTTQYLSPTSAQTEQDAPVVAQEQAPAAGTPRALSPAEAQAREQGQKVYTLQNDAFAVSFTDLNTAITSVTIKGKRYLVDGKPYELVTTDKERYLPFAPSFSGVTIPPDARWTLIDSSDERLEFRWQGAGVSATRTWTLSERPYQLESLIEVNNEGPTTLEAALTIRSAHYVSRAEEKGGFMARPSPKLSHGICQQGDETFRQDREDLLLNGEEGQELQSWGPGIEFVALSSVYFATIAAPEGETAERCELFTTDRGGTLSDPDGSLFEAALVYPSRQVAPGGKASFRTSIYAGPKDFDALEGFGHGASNVIDLGWFSFIAKGMSWLLRTIQGWVGNWGLAIILLTIFVRLLLLPAVVPQFKNMAKQRALKPEIDRINELYKDDREKKGAAMMELWRKNKVNPLGGCLPVLLQMPIFFALYQTLATSIELYHAPFVWWWKDLSSPDPYYVLPLMLGLLMFVQQKLTPVAMDAAQAKVMLYVMPLMMTAFMILLPTGLCLYMVTSSAIGISQQRYMYWKMDQEQAQIEPHTGLTDDPDGKDDATASKSVATPKRAQSRRKKRPGRGRA